MQNLSLCNFCLEKGTIEKQNKVAIARALISVDYNIYINSGCRVVAIEIIC